MTLSSIISIASQPGPTPKLTHPPTRARRAGIATFIQVKQVRVPGINLDDTEGAMVRLAQSLGLSRHIKRHNNPDDPYHMDEHQTFCLGYQFKDGITFMCLSTPHMLRNFARMTNCGWQK